MFLNYFTNVLERYCIKSNHSNKSILTTKCKVFDTNKICTIYSIVVICRLTYKYYVNLFSFRKYLKCICSNCQILNKVNKFSTIKLSAQYVTVKEAGEIDARKTAEEIAKGEKLTFHG